MKPRAINKERLVRAGGPLLLVVALVALLAGLGVMSLPAAQASFYGRSGYSGNPATNGGNTCTTCHEPGASVPTITLNGPASVQAGSLSYEADESDFLNP